MKATEFAALGKKLLPSFRGFSVKGSMMLSVPIGRVLKGVYFERSSNRFSFYIWRFAFPLCIPAEEVSFNIGDRLRNGMRCDWNWNAPDLIADLSICIEEQAIPFLDRVQTLDDFVKEASSLRHFNNVRILQAIAYALAYSGERVKATESLNDLMRRLDLRIEWMQEIREQCMQLLERLERNQDEAQKLLATWERQTVKNLGLSSYVQDQAD